LTRRISKLLVLALVLTGALASTGTANAQTVTFGPPWCGTPENDAAGNLPDGSLPTHPVGSFPHIPYYAIKCTLDSIAAQSNGRMQVEQIGNSALGRPLYLVTFNVLETKEQRKAYENWKHLRKDMLKNPSKALKDLAKLGSNVKIPIYVQGGIHGNEYEGVESNFESIWRLATTPRGVDPAVDAALDHAILLFNVIQNPDGRVAGTRANGNGFDLNRDFLTQSQPETQASVAVMQEWLPPEMLDLHGYVTPTLIEATTKPHNPSIEYDLWLKWNQPRIDHNEAAMNAQGFAVTRPINDWCPNGSPAPASGLCAGGIPAGPAVAEGWDDWGPFYTPMYAQHVGLDGSTVEMCNQTNTNCGVPGSTAHTRGRLGARVTQDITVWSTIDYVVNHRQAMLNDMLVRNERGVQNAARPDCCPPPFDVANNWMTEHPRAFVIPLGEGQRSDAEANRLVEWLLFNGIEVEELDKKTTFDGKTYEKGSYVVWMTQAFRGLAATALGLGSDISADINQLYAPPASWSHGYLWGADVVTIARDAAFSPKTSPVKKPSKLKGGVEKTKPPKPKPGPRLERYLLEMDSPTAVRTLNALVAAGLHTEVAMASFTDDGDTYPAGSAVFTVDPEGRKALDKAGKDAGLTFVGVNEASLPALDPVDRAPRIAVLTAAVNQDVWSLRQLGFQADPVSTATINSALEDPLQNYDVIFNSASAYPAATNVVGRARIEAFFANGGGYIGAGTNGAAFLNTGAQVVGLTTATRGGGGRSGIVNWVNVGGANSPVVGAYPANDTMIVDPPTWYTGVPATMSVDGRYPATGILASGFWLTSDAQSVSAPNAAIIAHGMNTAGTARLATFANNPLYRADPEREWPALGSAIYWSDQ
jgi:hypothetical protein